MEEQNRLMGNMVHSIKNSMVFPKWAVKLIGVLLIVVFLVLGYSVYMVSQIPKKEQTAFKKGEDGAILYFRAFFEANPEAKGLYKNWIGPKNKK